MTQPVIAVERRQHPREGVMGRLADVTYAVLRKYQIGEGKTGQFSSPAPGQ
jgi:hypothetical protein